MRTSRSTRAAAAARGLLFALVLVTAAAGAARATVITSSATGNWSATGTWTPAQVPGAADTVVIANGTTVTIDPAGGASCSKLTVGQGTSGVLVFLSSAARTLTVGGDVTIAAGGTLQSATSGTVTTHVLSIGGNLTNNGTLDLSTATNAAAAGLTFTGAANTTFSGTGATTDLRTLTINKGTSSASVLEITTSAFTVQGASTDGTASAMLTLTNGTLKVSGTFSGTHRLFAGVAAYAIPATGGIWLNNPNFTIAGQNASPTNNGLIRLTQGTFNIGTASGNAIGAGAGAVFTIEGGTMNVAGRILTASAITWNQSAGTVNVSTLGNGSNGSASFDLTATTTSFTMSGGSIVLVQGNSGNQAAQRVDYRVSAASPSITGGTLQVGTAATVTPFAFAIAGAMPSVVVDNTTNNKTVALFAVSPVSSALDVTLNNGTSLNLNAFPLTARNVTIGTSATLTISGTTLTANGTTFTNNGTLTGTTSGTSLVLFNDTQAMSYAGTGAVTSPLDGLTVDAPQGLTLGAAVPVITTLNARLFRGTVTNSNRLTLGTGAAAAVTTTIGKSGLTGTGGSFDVAPTFNLGTGAYTASYQPEGAARTTGVEIPASRTVTNLTINNANGVTLAGGNLTASGAVTFTSGTLTTGASTLALTSTGTVSRTSGHVVGNLKKNVATGATSRTFEVGTGADYTPVTVAFGNVSVAGDLTATSVAGEHPQIATSGLNPAKDVNRYWNLTNGGITFTNYSVTLGFVSGDVDAGSNTAVFGLRKYNSPIWSFVTPGTRTATSTQGTGLTSFSDFAVGEVAGTHTITASAGANGTISPSGAVSVADGTNQTFNFTPAACYKVADVQVDGVSVGAPASFTFTNVTLDHTISVTFTNQYTITASAGATGAISPSGAVAVTGCTDQTFTITPSANHHILDVLVDGASVGPVASWTFTNVTANHTIAASFAIDNIISVASGNWSQASTWSDGLVPTAADTVIIANGTTVTIDVAAACFRLVVGQGTSGTLQYEATTARTLTVGSTVTIASGGTFQSAATGAQAGHVLSLPGNLTNNGTLDFSTSGNTAGAGITFTGASSATFSGTGATTDLRTLTVNKGTSAANVLELSPASLTIQGSTTDGTGSAFLTLSNGTFKVSGTFAGTHRTFTSAAYTIGATTALWLNNPNFTIAGQNGSPINNGLLRVTQGTMNVGTTAGNEMSWGAGAQFAIEGGIVNIASRLRSANAMVWNQGGGTVNVTTVGNATSSAAGFELTSVSNNFTMSGGTIALVNPSSAGTKRDYNVTAGTVNITGGTLQAGTGASPAAANFQIAGLMPDLVVDNTTNTKTATIFGSSPGTNVQNLTIASGSTLNLNGFTLVVLGGTVTNNGTLTGTTAGSTLAFVNPTAAQSYTGAGAVTSALANLSVETPAGLTINAASPVIPVLNVSLFRGVVTNSGRLTLGSGGASAAATTIGKSGLPAAAGSYDSAPTFNAGTGGYSVSYQPEASAARTTGFEIPPGRSIRNFTINHAGTLTLGGGSLTATGVVTFTAGNFTTGASSLILTSTASVARTSGHVIGFLQKNVATGAGVARTFEVGTGSDYTPVNVTFASVTAAGDLTTTSIAGDHPSLAGSVVNPLRSVNRYWNLSNSGVGFTTADVTLNFVPADVDGGSNTGSFVVAKYDAPTWTAPPVGTRTATSTQATGLTSFSDLAVGENSHLITASAGANGSITPSGTVVVADGGSQTFNFTPAACYRVLDVLVDGVSVGAPASYAFTNVTANHTIAVSFVNTFTITASAGPHGSITPSGAIEVPCGGSQGFTITADVDWHIADVLVDGVSVGPVSSRTFTNVNALHTISATFAIDNNPPVIANVPASATIPELAPYTFTATATDVETPGSLVFSLAGAPAGAAIDPSTGVFTWTPTEAQGPGVYAFTVRVTDGQWFDNAPITLTVTEVNSPTFLTGVPAADTIPESAPYTFTAIATDADLPPQAITFSLVGGPAGAAIDPLTGVFTWTPAETQGPGEYAFTVRVADDSDVVDASIALTVEDVNVAPALAGVPATVTIPELVPYTFTATATDVDVPVQTLTFSLVGAPDGAAIDPSTGVFTWTPTAEQPGLHAFAVRVTDGVANTDSSITITVGVTVIADLAATQVKSGNDTDGTTKVVLTWSDLPPDHTVEVYRAGFGGYPSYDGAGGTPPAVPAYPPGAPWVLTSVTASGTADEPPARDFWYYVAFVRGGTGVSAPSNETPGTLDYFLGDVSDGATAGQGDNAVDTADLSLLGAHYGVEGDDVAPFAYLDVGPTLDYSTDALPTTDGILDFEDLIVFAINVDAVSRPQAAPALAHRVPRTSRASAVPLGSSVLALDAGESAVVGDTIRCPVRLRSNGAVKGLSLRLAWDPNVVRPLGWEPGEMAKRAGALVLSPKPGTIDAAFLNGRAEGEGVLAILSFVTVGSGDPALKVEKSDVRDGANLVLALPVEVHAPQVLPRATALALAAPNPFRARTTLAFDLAKADRVEITIFSIDGRRVRTLMSHWQAAGHYAVVWNGDDAGGRTVPAGMYYARFTAGAKQLMRPIVFLR